MNEVNSLRKQIEREFLEKMRLEETIMETMRQKMTMDKVTQYANKMANKTRKLIAEQVSVCSRLWSPQRRLRLKAGLKSTFGWYQKSWWLTFQNDAVTEHRQQAWYFTEATKAIASMPPGHCLGGLEMPQ